MFPNAGLDFPHVLIFCVFVTVSFGHVLAEMIPKLSLYVPLFELFFADIIHGNYFKNNFAISNTYFSLKAAANYSFLMNGALLNK